MPAILSAKPGYAELTRLFTTAHEAGEAAAKACRPIPMHVVERANPLDDTSEIVTRYAPVADGACGFAWVNIRPGNSPAARHVKKYHGARKGYYGGVEIWVSAYGQSVTRKEAYASAYARVLSEAGIKAYSNSRLD